jgi:hypothetical protein
MTKSNEEFRIKFSKLNIDNSADFWKQYQSQTVVIGPNETWEFSSLLSLPLVRESSLIKTSSPFYYILNNKKKYKFALEYSIGSRVKMELTPDQIQELKNNNIEIFDGQLISNEVELISR